MLAAVDFNDDLRLEAGEVQNVAAKRNLPAKLEPNKSTPAQQVPQLSLGIGEIATQGARTSALQLGYRSVVNAGHGPLTRPCFARAPSPTRGEGIRASPKATGHLTTE